MKIDDPVGETPDRAWFQKLADWTRKKITFDDNMDCKPITAYIGLTETEVGHPLGRTPRYIIEVAAYPHGTAGISFTKAPNQNQLFLKRSTAGTCTLLLF